MVLRLGLQEETQRGRVRLVIPTAGGRWELGGESSDTDTAGLRDPGGEGTFRASSRFEFSIAAIFWKKVGLIINLSLNEPRLMSLQMCLMHWIFSDRYQQ